MPNYRSRCHPLCPDPLDDLIPEYFNMITSEKKVLRRLRSRLAAATHLLSVPNLSSFFEIVVSRKPTPQHSPCRDLGFERSCCFPNPPPAGFRAMSPRSFVASSPHFQESGTPVFNLQFLTSAPSSSSIFFSLSNKCRLHLNSQLHTPSLHRPMLFLSAAAPNKPGNLQLLSEQSPSHFPFQNSVELPFPNSFLRFPQNHLPSSPPTSLTMFLPLFSAPSSNLLDRHLSCHVEI